MEIYRAFKKFTGTLPANEVLYGYPYAMKNVYYIVTERMRVEMINPDTVDRFTGAYDIHGERIFINDILEWAGPGNFIDSNIQLVKEENYKIFPLYINDTNWKKIGNIYGDIELLKNKKQ